MRVRLSGFGVGFCTGIGKLVAGLGAGSFWDLVPEQRVDIGLRESLPKAGPRHQSWRQAAGVRSADANRIGVVVVSRTTACSILYSKQVALRVGLRGWFIQAVQAVLMHPPSSLLGPKASTPLFSYISLSGESASITS